MSNGNGRWKWTAGILAGVCVALAGGFGQAVRGNLKEHDAILREHDITLSAMKEGLVRIEEKLDILLKD